MKFPRPLTHDLFPLLIRGLGGTLTRVLITRVHDNTYFAELVITRGDEVFTVDARPSDSIAIALRTRAELFTTEDLLTNASIEMPPPARTEFPSEEGGETPRGPAAGAEPRAAQGIPPQAGPRRPGTLQPVTNQSCGCGRRAATARRPFPLMLLLARARARTLSASSAARAQATAHRPRGARRRRRAQRARGTAPRVQRHQRHARHGHRRPRRPLHLHRCRRRTRRASPSSLPRRWWTGCATSAPRCTRASPALRTRSPCTTPLPPSRRWTRCAWAAAT